MEVTLLNALSKYDPRTPRERFWSEPQSWPDDTPDHQFVGRLILSTGATLAGSDWSDSDPATALPARLPEWYSLGTPMPAIYQASAALQQHVEAYRERSGGGLPGFGPDFPTRDEWRIARELVEREAMLAEGKFYRFLRACLLLEGLFKNGTFKTATSAFAGGELTKQPWHFWNMKHSWCRFDTCRVNPNNHFDRTPAEWGGSWIFVERKIGAAEVASAISEAPRATDAQLAGVVKEKPRSRGRKPKQAWDDIMSEFVRIVHAEGIPADANISEHARRLASWATEEGLDDIPEPKTIESKIRHWLRRFRQAG